MSMSYSFYYHYTSHHNASKISLSSLRQSASGSHGAGTYLTTLSPIHFARGDIHRNNWCAVKGVGEVGCCLIFHLNDRDVVDCEFEDRNVFVIRKDLDVNYESHVGTFVFVDELIGYLTGLAVLTYADLADFAHLGRSTKPLFFLDQNDRKGNCVRRVMLDTKFDNDELKRTLTRLKY